MHSVELFAITLVDNGNEKLYLNFNIKSKYSDCMSREKTKKIIIQLESQ